MLGFEFSGHGVRPKILARENATLHMYYMDNLNIMEGRDFGTLVKLMIAFLVLVESFYVFACICNIHNFLLFTECIYIVGLCENSVEELHTAWLKMGDGSTTNDSKCALL